MALTTSTIDPPTGRANANTPTHEAAAVPLWDEAGLAKWNALLDSFRDGEEDDHRDTVSTLAQALNEDRPGQRRVFGTGTNPKSADQ